MSVCVVGEQNIIGSTHVALVAQARDQHGVQRAWCCDATGGGRTAERGTPRVQGQDWRWHRTICPGGHDEGDGRPDTIVRNAAAKSNGTS